MTRNPFAVRFTNRRYLDAVEDHVVVFDGATGTQLAKSPLTVEDFGGERTEGLMEMLVFHRPEVVEAVHAAYLAAGAEAVETDTLRANRITLAEFGVEERALEINRRAATIARRAADRLRRETGIPRFVAGSMGPTGKLPSLDDPELSDVTFDALVEAYAEQARGLLEGGVDVLLLETQQDLLELKAAIYGIWQTFRALGVRAPIQAQVTLDAGGRMLTGPDVEAAAVALAALPVDIIGMNCSTGPDEMRESVRRLLALTNRPVSVLPNAGMPENVDGRAVYHMQPEPFAVSLAEFARWGVRAVGGCCGTGPEHITALCDQLHTVATARVSRPAYSVEPLPYVAGNIQSVALHQEPRPLIVGERINTQGSRKVRELVMAERYDALLELAETQVEYGAHVLDVCVALTERADEADRMRRVVKLLSLNTPAPLMIDTTDLEVMRAALETYPGRAIINSVNLEAGEAHALEVLGLAREFGAALIALTIDEQGMARTADRKLEVARRIYHLAVDDVGLPPHALIFDPLTFTLATGDAETASAAVETLDAIRRIKAALPGVLTNLGVSNVSYGLKPDARRVLNSVFLYRAVEAGLDLAIVNPAQITPYPDIPAEARALADDLIFQRRPEALARYIAHFEGLAAVEEELHDETLSPEERLFHAVTRRRREGVEALVDACLESHPPLDVLNGILLPAMKEVGDRFGAGELILPFVLKSAEVMKAAVTHLEQYLDHAVGISKGTVVLATVFGDVHDIGKNLVKTILANNGYTVHDLGKQVPVDVIIDRAVEVNADAIGLSALLVATSRQMQRAVEELQRRGLHIPLLVGGAAINPAFAQRIAMPEGGDLYTAGVYYCKDAFEALQVLEHIVMFTPPPPPAHPHGEGEGQSGDAGQPAACATCGGCALPDAPLTIPVPPFWGTRVVPEIPLAELLPLLDRKSLFRVGWGARGATGERWEALQAEFEARLTAMAPQAGAYLKPQAVYGYFPAQSDCNDLVIYDPADPMARREIARFTFPRQTSGKRLSLADYFAPAQSAAVDVVALQVVTVGSGAAERFGALDSAGDYSEAYFVHGLAAHTAEAAAEWTHRRIRRELGLVEGQGKRYSWGYPACPDLDGHCTLFRLLPAESSLGMTLSPAAQLIPEYSTAALVIHHPEAVYFAIR
jgi:5-methyltetrahydrofolate--homocysteine methyltransferase